MSTHVRSSNVHNSFIAAICYMGSLPFYCAAEIVLLYQYFQDLADNMYKRCGPVLKC